MSIASTMGLAAKAGRSLMNPGLGYKDARWVQLTACKIAEVAHLIRPALLSGVSLKVGRSHHLAIIMSRASS